MSDSNRNVSNRGIGWAALGLALLFVVLCMAAVYDIGKLTGKNRIRMSVCVSKCDAKTFDLGAEEYAACLEKCNEYRCK